MEWWTFDYMFPYFVSLSVLQASSQCTKAMLTSESSPQSTGSSQHAMPETQDADMTSWSEAKFEEKCTHIVKDQLLEEASENNNKTRAERSLPRNLALKRCHSSAEVRSSAHLSCLLVIQITKKFSVHSLKEFLQKNESRKKKSQFI